MEIRHILVPVDFGDASADALELACELAKKLDAKLTLLHSFYVPPSAYGFDTMLWAADWGPGSRGDLEALAAETKLRHPATEGIWLEGDPRDTIIETARQRGVDMIVAGTHGRRGLSRLYFGSVAGRLVRTSPVPIITTVAGPKHHSLRPRIRHILVATDFGEPAADALALACGLARPCDAHITVAHSVSSITPQAARTMSPDALPLAMAKRALAAEVEPLKAIVSRVDSVVVQGDAREQILQVATDCKADMIAMGTHASRGLSRYLLGSVAETVVRNAKIPVLTTAGPVDGVAGR